MIECAAIDEYMSYCKENPEKINSARKKLINNIVTPLIKDETIYFDKERYEICIRFCETNYFKLLPYQKFIYAFAFMYRNYMPVFSTFFVMMGRGNGKTSGFMPLMNFFLTPLYGVKNYHVDIIANNEEQAKKDFGIVYEMLEGKKEKFKKSFYWTKSQIQNKATRSEIRFNTSNAKTKDGKEGGALLFDEFHAYETYDQINVFSSQLGKIKHARTFIITTQGYVRDGPLDEMLTVCRQILETGENDLSYFPFICELDSREEAENPENWIKANPSIEYMPILKNQICKDFAEQKQLPSKRAEFYTKRMNLPDRDDEITVTSWENIMLATVKDTESREPRKTPELTSKACVIGIDYADIRDFAAAGVLFKIGDEYIWRQHTWICSRSPTFANIKFPFKNLGQEEFEDFEIVDEVALSVISIVEWCLEQAEKYSVQKIVMDTYRFGLFREAFESVGIKVESKSNPYGLVRMIRHLNSIETLTAPTIEKAFAEHRVNYGPSAIMRWFTNNTSVTIDKMGNKQYAKIEPKLRKNDGFMAFVVAMSCEDMLGEQVLYI